MGVNEPAASVEAMNRARVEATPQYKYTRDYTFWLRAGRPGGRFPHRKYGISWPQSVAIRLYVIAELRKLEKR